MRDDLTHIYNDTNIKRISCNYLQYKNSDRLQGFGGIFVIFVKLVRHAVMKKIYNFFLCILSLQVRISKIIHLYLAYQTKLTACLKIL